MPGVNMMPSKTFKALLLMFVLGFTLSMSACSPGPYVFLGIDQIEVGENVIQARSTQYCRYEDECEDGAIIHVYYASQDQGQTWKQVDLHTVKMEAYEADTADYHVSMCLSNDPKRCYRIDEQEYVEASNDGGTTWSVDWQIPHGRKLYMERYSYTNALHITPYDLDIIETGDEHLVIVAMGNEGVLVRSVAGAWNRYAVDTMTPTPYQAETLEDALGALIYLELPMLLLIAAAVFLLLTFSAWLTFFVRTDRVIRRKILLSLLPGLFALVLVSLYFAIPFLLKHMGGIRGMRTLVNAFFLMSKMYVGLAPLLTYVLTWASVLSLPSNPKLGLLAFLISVILPVLLAIFALLPYVLWAFGTIQIHETAQISAIVIGVILLLLAFYFEIRTAALSARIK
jgi:hypothetical protein